MMKWLFLNLALFFFSGLVCAQVTISDFIRSAEDDQEVKSVDAQINYLKSKPYRLSPLQKLEFRTQNRELLYSQQEYALRLNPANPWEMRSNNKYFEEYSSSLSIEKEVALKNALVDRYNLVILYLYYFELKSLAERNANLVKRLTSTGKVRSPQ